MCLRVSRPDLLRHTLLTRACSKWTLQVSFSIYCQKGPSSAVLRQNLFDAVSVLAIILNYRLRKSTLHDVPTTLSYEITKKLDVGSQRSQQFLASSQLYNKWHLQVSFLKMGLNLLVQPSACGSCNMDMNNTICVTHVQAKVQRLRLQSCRFLP